MTARTLRPTSRAKRSAYEITGPMRLVPLHALDAVHRIEDGGQAEVRLVPARLLAHPVVERGEVDAAHDDPGGAQGDEEPPDLLLRDLEVDDHRVARGERQRFPRGRGVRPGGRRRRPRRAVGRASGRAGHASLAPHAPRGRRRSAAPRPRARPSAARTRCGCGPARRTPPRARPPRAPPRGSRWPAARRRASAATGTSSRWGTGRRLPRAGRRSAPSMAVRAVCRVSRRRSYSAVWSATNRCGPIERLHRAHLGEARRALRAVGDERRAGVDERRAGP